MEEQVDKFTNYEYTINAILMQMRDLKSLNWRSLDFLQLKDFQKVGKIGRNCAIVLDHKHLITGIKKLSSQSLLLLLIW